MKVSVIQIALVANDSSIQIALVALSFCITTIIMDVLGKMKMTVPLQVARRLFGLLPIAHLSVLMLKINL